MSQNIFLNPKVSVAPALTLSSVGNGTLTVDKLTHFTVNQTYTAICTSIDPFTVFNIIGSLDGAVGVAVVGTQFNDEDAKIFLTIQQGPNLFAIGDTFEWTVVQGTDVTQENIDSYDELPQKNFGQGPVGQNKGDHNLRFNSNPALAFKDIGDLKYTAVESGPDGNEVSVQYLPGTMLTAASLTLQSLSYLANAPGANGNNIRVQYENYDPAVVAEKIIQDLDYSADVAGTGGNGITIRYTNTATAGFETVSVVGQAITVGIQSGVTTADQIRLAIGLSGPASALVDVLATGTGSETQIAQPATNLVGGINAVGDAGNEVVTVVSNLIKVKFQSGVSTATQIYNKLIASGAVLGLVTPSISGVGSSTQTAPVAATNLIGGADDVGSPGNEIVSVSGKEIKITFTSGISTASQIRTKFLANAQAVALATITLLGTGAEAQTSPLARTFLTGGRDSGSFAFNTAELTDPTNFYEGNAKILVTDITNQGDELTLGETIKKGKVTLDDDIGGNNSGPSVENAQKTINSIIQNSKAIIVTEDNSKVNWTKPKLFITADILFIFPETGNINRIHLSTTPITIDAGQHCYVIIDRLNNVTVTPVVSNAVPTGENVFRLFSRNGDALVWYDNTLQRDKKKIRIGEGGGGGTAYQEKIGTGNGIATSFALTFVPSNEFSILVICSRVRAIVDDYNYNPTTNSIDFVSAQKPAAGQDVYVLYLTDGETIEVPTPDGLENSFVHTVTASEELAKAFTLPNNPAVPSKVLVDIIEGGPQEFNVDYNISVDQFQWSGYSLDGLLTEGDKVRLHYYS